MSVLHSPIDGRHRARGARMTHFGAWELPVSFSTIIAEHLAVRSAAGLFDISHLGRIPVSGEAAAEVLGGLVTAVPAAITVGSGRYTMILNDQAGIEDDMFIYRTGDSDFLLVPNASNTAKVFGLVEVAARAGAGKIAVEDVTAENAVFALQGPRAAEVLAAVGGDASGASAKYGISSQVLSGVNVLVSRSGYTGEDGFELYLFEGGAQTLWEAILDAGAPLGLLPCGLGARDTLRLEMCYPLWGQDIDSTTTPLEAGLMFAVDIERGNFSGKPALQKQMAEGARRKLCALELEQGIPRAGSEIFSVDATSGSDSQAHALGRVTSGSFSPSLGRGIALGYVESNYASAGRDLAVDIRGRRYHARIMTKPLYKKENQ